jgi:hypothetical protein
VTEFFGKDSSSQDAKKAKPARKVSDSKAKPKAAAKKKVVESDDEGDLSMSEDLPRPPPRRTVARAAAKSYVDVDSDGDDGDDSLFQDG